MSCVYLSIKCCFGGTSAVRLHDLEFMSTNPLKSHLWAVSPSGRGQMGWAWSEGLLGSTSGRSSKSSHGAPLGGSWKHRGPLPASAAVCPLTLTFAGTRPGRGDVSAGLRLVVPHCSWSGEACNTWSPWSSRIARRIIGQTTKKPLPSPWRASAGQRDKKPREQVPKGWLNQAGLKRD